ncbi:hypothetical protein BHE74_00042809 [Ensete ventricosum]|nr:hypothetical protein BHE74_00042809 [Ensete ventricosum]
MLVAFCRKDRYWLQSADATRVEIATIHLKGDVIQWFNWYEHTHGETTDWRDDSQERGHIISDPNNLRMKVDFPRWARWEEGDRSDGSHARSAIFWFYRIADATRVEIATIHLEGDAIQQFN